MMDIALALDALVPGAEYEGSLTAYTEDAFNALRWVDGRPKPRWQDVVVKAEEGAKRRLENAVNAHRDRLAAAGGVVDVGQGKALALDLRDEEDFRNVISMYARAETAMRESEAVQFFVRDAANAEHVVSVDEMIVVGKSIYDGIAVIYRASWAVKAQIAAGTLTDAADIPAAFSAILEPAP